MAAPVDLACDQLKTDLVRWMHTTTDPMIGGGLPAPIGSTALLGNGSAHQIYQKTGTPDAAGWSLQNLVGLRVFNIVRDFGAVGDGTTDNRAAIEAAIAAAKAVGGGIIYVPPGAFAIYRSASSSDIYSFDVDGLTNTIFLGDGIVSQLRMVGSAHGFDWTMFLLHDFTASCRFVNLFFDAEQVTDQGSQTHVLQPEGIATDPTGSGPIDITIEECFFGAPVGDAVRNIGEVGREVQGLRVRYNVFNCVDTGTLALDARSCISVQRGCIQNSVYYNWFTGSHDQAIDFEPTGVGAVTDWLIYGNQFDHQGIAICISIGGVSGASRAQRIVVACNSITNGGNLFGSLIQACAFIGNIVTMTSTDSADTQGALEVIEDNEDCVFAANVLYNAETSTILTALLMEPQGASASPIRGVIADNLIRGEDCTDAVHLESWNDLLFSGNIVTGKSTGAAGTTMIFARAVANQSDLTSFVGNLVVSDNTVTNTLAISASPANQKNCQVASNFVRNGGTGVGIAFIAGGGGVYVNGWRYAGDNLVVASGDTVELPPNHVGCTGCGPAGPGPQIAMIDVAAGPGGDVSAPVGSLCSNTAGGQATTLFYKETGSGLSGGSAGWLGIGGDDVAMGAASGSTATSAMFFAPGGAALAAETTTEIQWTATRSCRLRNFYGKFTAGVGGGTNTYTVRKNGADTVVTFGVLNTATSGNDTTHNVTAVAGDLISADVTKSVAPATPQTHIQLTIEVI